MELRTARSKLCQLHTCQPSHISLQGRKNREINSGHSLNEIRTGRICFLNASAPRRRERTTRGETLGDSQRPERGREQHPGERKALFFPLKEQTSCIFTPAPPSPSSSSLSEQSLTSSPLLEHHREFPPPSQHCWFFHPLPPWQPLLGGHTLIN